MEIQHRRPNSDERSPGDDPRPWPRDPIEQLVWLCTSDAEPWVPRLSDLAQLRRERLERINTLPENPLFSQPPPAESAEKGTQPVPDSFDSDPNTLPTVTKAHRQAWDTTAPGGHIDAVATTFSMRAVLDAVHALEDRVTALEP